MRSSKRVEHVAPHMSHDAPVYETLHLSSDYTAEFVSVTRRNLAEWLACFPHAAELWDFLPAATHECVNECVVPRSIPIAPSFLQLKCVLI